MAVRILVGLLFIFISIAPRPVDMAMAAYFDDENDRESLNRLRNLRASGGILSEAERAILQAADRTGAIIFPNCVHPETMQPVNGNAFLIDVDGRDAVITAAHFIKEDQGDYKAGCDLEGFLDAEYAPNVTYYGQTGLASLPEDLLYLRVSATLDTRFGAQEAHSIKFDTDWILLFLDENISKLPAPNQQQARGTFSFFQKGLGGNLNNPTLHVQSTGIIIGEDSRQELGVTTWQKDCKFKQFFSKTYHTCDTDKRSSGSIFGVMQAGEIRFQSMNIRASSLKEINESYPLPADHRDWNQAISASHIEEEIRQVIGSP